MQQNTDDPVDPEEYETLKEYAELNKQKTKPFAEILLRNLLRDAPSVDNPGNSNPFPIITRFFIKRDLKDAGF